MKISCYLKASETSLIKMKASELGNTLSLACRHKDELNNVSTEGISIASAVLSHVMGAVRGKQDANMKLLLSNAGIFVFFLCAQNRCLNSLRSPVRRENSFLVVCVLRVPYFRLILFVASRLSEMARFRLGSLGKKLPTWIVLLSTRF